MKRISYIWFAGTVLTGMLTMLAFGQSTATPSPNSQEPSLGSYARAVRKGKAHSAKQFDNDNLPKDDKISVVGDKDGVAEKSPASPDIAPAPTGAAGNQDMPKVAPGQTQEQRQQVYDQWQQKITFQQGEVDQIARELDLDQREYRLRAASFYADAGERMRNEAAWDKEDADYKQKIAEKQKALDDAKQKLSDLQEEARKAGVPSSAQAPQAPDSD